MKYKIINITVIFFCVMFFVAGFIKAKIENKTNDTEETIATAQGAGREETRQILTETIETVVDTVESVETETNAETSAENDTDAVTETETETTAEIETEAATESETETTTETTVEIIADEPLSEYANYCPLPLDDDAVLREVCNESGVPYAIAMALIYTESRFNPYAVNPASGCYGYCQLHPAYFPANLSPADNIRYGIGWLGELIAEYGDIGAALTVYAYGHDNGNRWYANVVMERAQEWGFEG